MVGAWSKYSKDTGEVLISGMDLLNYTMGSGSKDVYGEDLQWLASSYSAPT